ncbi:MAG: amidophosphoribosyltransferase, partial [Oscillospiraceae bacterium]|nr:amidophosphoribosyltransferase [Oscillospiraceae bacterium]
EIVTVTDGGRLESDMSHAKSDKTALCVFEFIYTARPDSVIDGCSVHFARRRAGALLARQHPVEADVVIGVPDSGLDAALGYALESGIPYSIGLIKNKYIGRTFIQPLENERKTLVRIKLNAIDSVIRGKRVVMVDDSIVRGTTIGWAVKVVLEAGAKEIHLRSSAPPFLFPCYYGTDIDSPDKLIANQLTLDEIARHYGVTTLGYLNPDSIPEIAPEVKLSLCDACFTGNYPCEIRTDNSKPIYMMKLSERNQQVE